MAVAPSPTTHDRTVAVYGASGHTGRFVVSELRRRGWTLILSGRDAEKLNAVRDEHPGAEVRSAWVDAPESLDRAFLGASAVINCAGPFIDTAAPIMEAAIRARIHYLDVTAEQPAALAAFERFTDAARNAGIVIAPAMAFYGGLGDLLATAATGDWQSVDDVRVAVALDSWKPTRGTRFTGRRNPGRRLVFSKGRLQHVADPPPTRTWSFPAPFGALEVVAFPLTEIITISRHLPTPEAHAYMNLAPLSDLHDPGTPAPTATDESGRSDQLFLMDVIARRGREERHATARGRDIYAISAPIVVEAATRILDGHIERIGVATAGELFDAHSFLEALSNEHLSVDLP